MVGKVVRGRIGKSLYLPHVDDEHTDTSILSLKSDINVTLLPQRFADMNRSRLQSFPQPTLPYKKSSEERGIRAINGKIAQEEESIVKW